VAKKGSLFLFDEPTTGLHFDDVARLMGAFRKLLGAGHSLLVIEHNLDVIRAADWLIDLGPEGGVGGGRVIAEGTPDTVMDIAHSHTGVALRDYESNIIASAPLTLQEPQVAYAGSTALAVTRRETPSQI